MQPRFWDEHLRFALRRGRCGFRECSDYASSCKGFWQTEAARDEVFLLGWRSRRTGWNGTPTRNLQLYVKHANLMSTWEPIYGKSLCIESLHDRVHRVALDSLGAITLHCRIRFARKTLSARASSCSTHKLFLLVNACVSGPQIFSIYVRPSIISNGADMYIYTHTLMYNHHFRYTSYMIFYLGIWLSILFI